MGKQVRGGRRREDGEMREEGREEGREGEGGVEGTRKWLYQSHNMELSSLELLGIQPSLHLGGETAAKRCMWWVTFDPPKPIKNLLILITIVPYINSETVVGTDEPTL